MSIGDGLSWGFPRQGWQCPCCKAVFSPDTVSCWNCRPIQTAFYSNTVQVTSTQHLPAEWEIVANGGNGYTIKKKA